MLSYALLVAGTRVQTSFAGRRNLLVYDARILVLLQGLEKS